MEKKFKRGLVLGKFMPPHNGHLHLINSAAEQCEKVFVMICSMPDEPINGYLRYNWLKFIYDEHKNIEIIHVHKKLPQHPTEMVGLCKAGSEINCFYEWFWVPIVDDNVKNLDVLFTSEKYGDEFARYLGIPHVLVDINRETYQVSGTKIRNNPAEYWKFIPDEVKPYFTKRIAVMGPESTGKSTLVSMLAHDLGTSYITEYGREYVEKHVKGTDLQVDDFFHIAETHNDRLLEKHISVRRPWLIADTEAITTKLFGQMYIKDYKDDRIDEIIKYQWFDLYLLMDIDIPWVNDGTRDFPNDRQRHFNMIKDELDRLGRNYVIIKGDYDERLSSAKKEIEKLGYLTIY